MKRIFFLAIAMIFITFPKLSAQSDFGTWSSIQVVKAWEKPYAMARFEHRSYQNAGATECYFAMAGGGYNFTKWLKADLSYEFWKIPASGNVTAHKAVFAATGTWKTGSFALALREKYEFAYIQEAKTCSHTLRSRLRAQYSIGHFTPYAMYEFFNWFDENGWIRSLYYVGTEFKFCQHHSFDLFYMLHQYDAGSSTGFRHLLGIGYNFVF